MDTENFKVLTLNCWGVFPPLFCEKRVERLSAITEKLSDGEYDVVLLQEVYLMGDYYKLREAMKFVFPYSNYFHSMMVGSGCCVFSKFKICESFFMPYTLNGYTHKIEHGDFYAGKGIGLVVLQTKKHFIINVYVTHTHARYQSVHFDSYSVHRLNQGLELGQFINLTSRGCDAVVLGGDLNMDNTMLGFRILTSISGLRDAWLTQETSPDNPEVNGATSCRPDNSYCCKKWLSMHAHGERLDYILYKQNLGVKLECIKCNLTMRRIPNVENINYSDHEGLDAAFSISRDLTAKADRYDSETVVDICRRSFTEFDHGLYRYNTFQLFRMFGLCCLLFVIVFNIPEIIFWSVTHLSFPGVFNRILIMLMSVVFFLLLWYTAVIKTAERKAINNSRQSLNWIIHAHSNPASLTNGFRSKFS